MQTKIVCTLGPASSSEEVLRELILAGMDMVRLNFSHGTHEEMEAIFSTVRRISSEFSEQVPSALRLPSFLDTIALSLRVVCAVLRVRSCAMCVRCVRACVVCV